MSLDLWNTDRADSRLFDAVAPAMAPTTRQDKLNQTHALLIEAVESLTSGEEWRRMLDVARRFHSYSPNNVWLILVQAPHATRVAGFHTWKSLGRSVKKGERGIAILAPMVGRTRASAEREDGEERDPVKVVRGFRIAHVFDVLQTEGAPLDEVAPSLLTEVAPADVWSAVATQLADAGFSVVRGDCHGANGLTDFMTRTVTVRADVSEAQAAKTAIHELAHVLLHDTPEQRGCRDRAEVEAESIAYLVCQHLGVTSDTYSFPYIARWSGGDLELVRSTADRVISCARRIIDSFAAGHSECQPVAAYSVR